MHIVSNVIGELRDDRDALDLFAARSRPVPSPARPNARDAVDRRTGTGRARLYAGSVAHVDFDGDLDSCIVLRCVAVADGRAYWQASAGIVADSDPRPSMRKSSHKTRIVRSVLGLEP